MKPLIFGCLLLYGQDVALRLGIWDSARTAVLFSWYVRYLWPVHRLLTRRWYSPRCTSCAGSAAMVPIEADGRCQLCSEGVDPQSFPGDLRASGELAAILERYVGRGLRYDALVMFSGGKDSTYLLERVRRDHPGLRVLACTVDNGFMSEADLQHAADLVPQLGIDHVVIRPRSDFYAQLFRYGLTHVNMYGGYGTVEFSDTEFVLDTARNLAYEKRIPLILVGYSRYQVQDGLDLDSFESPPVHERQERTHVAGMRLTRIFGPTEVGAWWHGTTTAPARLLFPLMAWDLEDEQIRHRVEQWGMAPAGRRPGLLDGHRLKAAFTVVDIHQLGFSSGEPETCRAVREGRADQRHWQHTFEALEYLARTGWLLRDLVARELAQLDLTAERVGINFGAKPPRQTRARGVVETATVEAAEMTGAAVPDSTTGEDFAVDVVVDSTAGGADSGAAGS